MRKFDKSDSFEIVNGMEFYFLYIDGFWNAYNMSDGLEAYSDTREDCIIDILDKYVYEPDIIYSRFCNE